MCKHGHDMLRSNCLAAVRAWLHPCARCKQLWNLCCKNASAFLFIIPFLNPDGFGRLVSAMWDVPCVGSLGLCQGSGAQRPCGCSGLRWELGLLGVKEAKPRLGFSYGEKSMSKPQTRVSFPVSGGAAVSETLLGSGKADEADGEREKEVPKGVVSWEKLACAQKLK